MGDEGWRTRRVKVAAGRSMRVHWYWDNDEGGWYWAHGNEFSFNNYLLIGDLVRFRHPARKKVTVGWIDRYANYGELRVRGRTVEPGVKVVDLGSWEVFTLDVEDVRPLYENWDGDPADKLPLDRATAAVIAKFDEDALPWDLTPRQELAELTDRLTRHLWPGGPAG